MRPENDKIQTPSDTEDFNNYRQQIGNKLANPYSNPVNWYNNQNVYNNGLLRTQEAYTPESSAAQKYKSEQALNMQIDSIPKTASNSEKNLERRLKDN